MSSVTTEASEAAPPTADQGEPAEPTAPGQRPPRLWRPSKAAVNQQLKALAAGSTQATSRRILTRLSRQLQAATGTAKRLHRIDTSIEALLATASEAGAESPLLFEAATWVVAWRQGSKHAGSTASLAAAVVAEATAAGERLAEGDTSRAAFVLTANRLLPVERPGRPGPGETLAWAACEAEIEKLVTPSGFLTLDHSAAAVRRVARWTHLREAAKATSKAARKAKHAFSRKAEKRWKQAVAATLRLLGPGGKPVAGGETPPLPAACGDSILRAALQHGSRDVRKAARLLRHAPAKQLKREDDALEANLDDRQAAVAVLRSGWQGRPLRVVLDYRREQPHLEVAAGSRMLLQGPWQWEVRLGKRSLAAEGPWQVTHAEEDDDVTLLVIAATLAGGLRLERHLLLGREDRVILLADAVVDAAAEESPAEVTYRSSLPVSPGAAVTAAEETRELTLGSSKPQAMLMPLAMPEWSAAPAAGSWGWQADADAVQLEQRSPVRRLFAPVWLDLAPKRFNTQVTWRQLTVADTRVILRPEQAAGFRIQAGLTQWLLYRALDEPRNRTVLGCNLSSFFRLGKLDDDGLVSQMAEW